MRDVFFHPPADRWPRVTTTYHRLMTDAEDYLQFGQMLFDGGQLNGKRILGSRTVEVMGLVFAPETLTGRAPGRGFGLSVPVVNDPIAAGHRVSAGSFRVGRRVRHTFLGGSQRKGLGVFMFQTDNPNR